MLKKLEKNYVSPIDQKLAEFNSTHLLTASQQVELQKYERIFSLRDQESSVKAENSAKLWEEF